MGRAISGSPVKVAVVSASFSRSPKLRTELLARFPNSVFNDTGKNLTHHEIVALAQEAEYLIVGTERIDAMLLQELPRVRTISKYGVGLDNVDTEILKDRKIALSWTKGTNKRSVAELALAFLIALFHRMPEQSRPLASGTWSKIVSRQLSDKTIGILGYGHVGKELSLLLAPFRCRILANDIRPDLEHAKTNGVEFKSLEEVLSESDAVSIHLPLTKETRGILHERRLRLMKSSSILVNTSRGGIVDEDALVRLLSTSKIAGAGFDVFDSEPNPSRQLVALPNMLATPHIGASTEEAVFAMGMAALDGLDSAKPVESYALLE